MRSGFETQDEDLSTVFRLVGPDEDTALTWYFPRFEASRGRGLLSLAEDLEVWK